MSRSIATLVVVAGVLASVLIPASTASADVGVSGRVTLSGQPVAGTEVGWYDPLANVAGETVTDAAGAYTLTVPAGHPFVLYAGADYNVNGKKGFRAAPTWTAIDRSAYIPAFRGADGSDFMYQSLAVFPADSAPAAGDIALGMPGAIAGSDPALAKQRVTLVTPDDGNSDGNGVSIDTVKADAEGAFSFTGLTPGRYRLTALDYEPGYLPWTSADVTVTGGATTTVVPTIETAESRATIRGRIVSGGEQLKGISVAYSLLGGNAGGMSGPTDAKGRFAIADLEPGRYSLTFNPGQDGESVLANNAWTQKSRKVRLSPTEDLRLGTIELSLGGTVRADVVAPSKSAFVLASLYDARGKVVGQFGANPDKNRRADIAMKGVAPGTYTALFTESAGKVYAKRPVTVRSGATASIGTVALVRPTVTVRGSVHGADRGTVVFATRAYPSRAFAPIRKGEYRLRGLVPGIEGELVSRGARELERSEDYHVPQTDDVENLKSGRDFGRVEGSFTVAGHAIVEGSISIDLDGLEQNGAQIRDDGTFSRPVAPGLAHLELITGRAAYFEFVEGSPFWLSLPPEYATVRIRSGQTFDLGAVELVVNR
jgi:hypothetical protein